MRNGTGGTAGMQAIFEKCGSRHSYYFTEYYLNSEQRTLIRPGRTLANTKLPPKTDSEATPT